LQLFLEMSVATKEKLLSSLKKELESKLEMLKNSLRSLTDTNDTAVKSSAGDKYETEGEMKQQEFNKMAEQIKLTNKMAMVFHQSLPYSGKVVASGSLVKLNGNWFYISIAWGKISIDAKEIQCISPIAPLAQYLLNKKVGDSFEFNGKIFVIEEVW
jgi:transcription elongation GreA/GreB family factor